MQENEVASGIEPVRIGSWLVVKETQKQIKQRHTQIPKIKPNNKKDKAEIKKQKKKPQKPKTKNKNKTKTPPQIKYKQNKSQNLKQNTYEVLQLSWFLINNKMGIRL